MALREQELFNAALEQTAGAARTAYLAAVCASDPALRLRVEALLRASEEAGGFLGESAVIEERPGARIGRYVLGERLGEGGFGVVYQAEQQQPVRRSVALKIIKLGMDTRAVVARFEAERQALAMMDHPNIAHVLDGGATEAGRPFFVMELVRGVPVTAYCDQQRLSVRARLDLFLQVCRAIHHAHQKGIIHRDLKPTNILVTGETGTPMVKVIDFGIAKATSGSLTDQTLLTRMHAFIGTPAYMSPEQIGSTGMDIDTRSDIYSLGVLLYELLTGEPALDAGWLKRAGYVEIQQAIQHTDPPPPSQRIAILEPPVSLAAAERRRTTPARLMAELRGDLDRIVRKCLEKDRTHRYETTEDLAQDIGRYLRNEPVLARPATTVYRATKFVQRHRRSVATLTAVAVLLVAMGIYHAHRLSAEGERVRLEAQKAAKVSELLTEIVTSADPFRTTGPGGVLGESVERVRTEFAGQPEIQAEILNAIGRVHLRRGEHDKALPVLTEALVAGRAIGRPNVWLAQALSDLGILHRERGNMTAAIPLLTEALTIRRHLFQEPHNDVAISLVELGRAHIECHRLDLAEPLYREALAIRQSALGEHRETATSLRALAILLWQKGDLAGSEAMFTQSIAMHRKTVGPDHPNVATSLDNYALLKIDQGDLAAAEALSGQAIAIDLQAMGEEHWRTALARAHLGEVWRRQNRHEEAATVLALARRTVRDAFGETHQHVAAIDVERAQVHLARGEPAAAEPLLRSALQVQLQLADGHGGWVIASTKSLLGAALLEQGRLDEAEILLEQAAVVLTDIPGPQGRETGPNRARLAALRARK